jgi:hypothetical protein
MGVKRDWLCKAHGYFESYDPKPLCPKGCLSVQKVFLQPPAYQSPTMKRVDNTLRWSAKQMGLSDMSGAQGRSVAENNRLKNWSSQHQVLQEVPRPYTFDPAGKDSPIKGMNIARPALLASSDKGTVYADSLIKGDPLRPESGRQLNNELARRTHRIVDARDRSAQ